MCPLSIPYPPLHHTCAGYRTNRETEQQSHRPQPTMNVLMHPRRERAGTQQDSQKKHPETRT